jgi:hypothetical protein
MSTLGIFAGFEPSGTAMIVHGQAKKHEAEHGSNFEYHRRMSRDWLTWRIPALQSRELLYLPKEMSRAEKEEKEDCMETHFAIRVCTRSFCGLNCVH